MVWCTSVPPVVYLFNQRSLGQKLKFKSLTGGLGKMSRGTPVKSQMLSGQETVTALLPHRLCLLWKRTEGALPLHPPPQIPFLLQSRAAWEVSDTSTTLIWCAQMMFQTFWGQTHIKESKILCWVFSKTAFPLKNWCLIFIIIIKITDWIKKCNEMKALCKTTQWDCLNAAQIINYENMWIIHNKRIKDRKMKKKPWKQSDYCRCVSIND